VQTLVENLFNPNNADIVQKIISLDESLIFSLNVLLKKIFL